MSVLLEDSVTKAMLDAYSAPGKGDHNISFARMLALIAVTNRFDLLDRELREIGAAVLVGEEIHTARLGHLKSKIAELSAELRAVERMGAVASVIRSPRKGEATGVAAPVTAGIKAPHLAMPRHRSVPPPAHRRGKR
ncbi:MAG: hypothetical protein F9K41_03075 [Sphingopyxis terrae]|nr:MAG: hypothetical protein F9K41_03075 [Sphingopyxis terrae]